MYTLPTLGPEVCKYYLHWAIWIPRARVWGEVERACIESPWVVYMYRGFRGICRTGRLRARPCCRTCLRLIMLPLLWREIGLTGFHFRVCYKAHS